MNWKRPLTLALSAALALSLAAPALAVEIPEGWTPADGARTVDAAVYTEAQNYVTEKGWMTGTDKGFEPEGLVTRATMYEMFWKMEGKPAAEKPTTFTDVAADAWYWTSASWAEATGLSNGDGGRYQGERNVTRAEVAAILYRYVEDKKIEVPASVEGTPDAEWLVSDFYVPQWAAEPFAWAVSTGIVLPRGEGDGVGYAPSETVVRGELARMLTVMGKAMDAQGESYVEDDTVAIEVAEQDKIPAHTIPATLCAPKDTEGKKLPAVVMLHGTGSNRDEAGNGYKMAAPVMADAGIVTLRIDFMGSGDSTASYTDYCFTSANIDAKAAADYLKSLDYVDDNKIAVMGWSQGGTNALLAAAEYPETFKAVITWAGSVTQRSGKEFQDQYATAKKNGYYEETFDWRDPLHVGLRWYEENISVNKLNETAKIKAPIFAIQGMKDTSVAPENANQIVKVARNDATRAFFIEDCDHTFNVFSEGESGYPTIHRAINAGIGFLQETFNGQVTGSVNAVSKYGNIGTDIPVDVFAGAGYATGDILKISIGSQSVEAPYGTGYSNVDTGKEIVLPDTSSNTVAAAINMGNFAKTYNAPEGTAISFAMGEKEGYLEEYEIRNIDALRTNVRKDYASDEVFANFRPVVMGDIAEGVLFRSSSPVNPELGRNTYADDFAKKNGVKTIIDLADSEEEYAAYEGVKSSYAYTTNTVKLDMGVDFAAEDFSAKLKTGLQYMLANEGPYLVHCNEGKDRCGFVTMVLECLMGGSVDEIVDDYMLSYENYYFVEHESSRWERIAQSNVIANLLKLTGAKDEKALAKADLPAAAQDYLTGTVGLSAEEVSALKDILAGK